MDGPAREAAATPPLPPGCDAARDRLLDAAGSRGRPQGRFIHIGMAKPDEDWQLDVETPWWQDAQYAVRTMLCLEL